MKLQKTKKIILAFTLDSSETIMFTKGGRHSFKFERDDLDDDIEQPPDFSQYDEVELTFQMERNEQGRFDFITGEAQQHKERENENKPS